MEHFDRQLAEAFTLQVYDSPQLQTVRFGDGPTLTVKHALVTREARNLAATRMIYIAVGGGVAIAGLLLLGIALGKGMLRSQ